LQERLAKNFTVLINICEVIGKKTKSTLALYDNSGRGSAKNFMQGL